MNLERGVRRLTRTISLAAIIAGLLLMVYATHRTITYVSGMRAFMACSEDPKSVAEVCASILIRANSAIPEPYRRLGFFWWNWRDSLLDFFFRMTNQSYSLVLIPLIGGFIVTPFIGAIPWGLFYLVRWIVQGFND